jgi:hypothetical protein
LKETRAFGIEVSGYSEGARSNNGMKFSNSCAANFSRRLFGWTKNPAEGIWLRRTGHRCRLEQTNSKSVAAHNRDDEHRAT